MMDEVIVAVEGSEDVLLDSSGVQVPRCVQVFRCSGVG